MDASRISENTRMVEDKRTDFDEDRWKLKKISWFWYVFCGGRSLGCGLTKEKALKRARLTIQQACS